MKELHNISIFEDKCVGCSLCSVVCPKGSITICERKKDGFRYPKIDYKSCINCGLCLRKCPITLEEKNKEINKPINVFAAVSSDNKIRENSASGGISTTFAKWVIHQGGAVCGAAYSDDFLQVKHIIVETESDLYKIQGSKYVQSNIEKDIYLRIKNELQSGRIVLFTGTHCQVAALYSFLDKKKYSNLVIVDVLCHGVPSPLAWKKYIEWQRKKHNNQRVISVNMKEKEPSWNQSTMKISFDSEVYCSGNDYWKMAFSSDILLRKSCYDCQFKRGKVFSGSDITIGDFWGGDDYDFVPKNRGLSFVMINTNHGAEFWNQIKDLYKQREISYSIVLEGNPMLEESASKNEYRDSTFKILQNHSYEFMMEKIFAHRSDVGIYIMLFKKKIKFFKNSIIKK